MQGTLQEAMTLTLGNEGQWYDGSHPSDPNPTMYGVTQARYDAYRRTQGVGIRTVRFIEQSEREAIYAEYWYGTCDVVAKTLPLVALCLFDMSINAGPQVARTILQSALDFLDDGHMGSLDHDGKLGPKTLAALATTPPAYDSIVCSVVLLERVRFYEHLAESAKLRPNLLSWMKRTVDFYDTYVRTAQ